MKNEKLNKTPYEELIAIVKNIVPQLSASLLSLLEQHDKPIEFDWENGYAPSIVSSQFDDDIQTAISPRFGLIKDLSW
jgi:hypothetical protein